MHNAGYRNCKYLLFLDYRKQIYPYSLSDALFRNFIYGIISFQTLCEGIFPYCEGIQKKRTEKRILVLGIDEQSIAIARAILDNLSLPYQVVGFLTQRTDSKRASLLGKPIYEKQKIEENTKEDLIIDGVLIVKEMMARDEMNSWVNLF